MEFSMTWLLAAVLVLFFVVLTYMIYMHLKESGQWPEEADAEHVRLRTKTAQAVVLGKRKRWSEGQLPTQPVDLTYLATFALEDGSKVELVLPSKEKYFWLTEGQRGTLQYDGQRYISFESDSDGIAGFIREFREENARVRKRHQQR